MYVIIYNSVNKVNKKIVVLSVIIFDEARQAVKHLNI